METTKTMGSPWSPATHGLGDTMRDQKTASGWKKLAAVAKRCSHSLYRGLAVCVYQLLRGAELVRKDDPSRPARARHEWDRAAEVSRSTWLF